MQDILTSNCLLCNRMFLLRDSQSNPKAFVLTLCHHQKIKHFQILLVRFYLFFCTQNKYSIFTYMLMHIWHSLKYSEVFQECKRFIEHHL